MTHVIRKKALWKPRGRWELPATPHHGADRSMVPKAWLSSLLSVAAQHQHHYLIEEHSISGILAFSSSSCDFRVNLHSFSDGVFYFG